MSPNAIPFHTRVVAGTPRSTKSKGLIILQRVGLPVPPSLIIANQPDSKDDLASHIRLWNQEVFYLRLCFSDEDYPHYDFRLATNDTLWQQLSQFVARLDPSCSRDIIVQPLLPFDAAGVLVVHENMALLEECDGASAILLKEGFFRYRSLWQLNGAYLGSQSAFQPASLRLVGLCFKRGPCKETASRAESLFKEPHLAALRHLASESAVWVIEVGWMGDTAVFVDLKRLSGTTYPLLRHTLDETPLIVHPERGDTPLSHGHFARADLNHIASARTHDSVYFAHGAVGAHLCVYLAQKGKGCFVGNSGL